MSNTSIHKINPALLFLLITFALSSIFYFLIISAGTLSAGNGLYVLGLMWCPGISAFITMQILKGNWRALGWTWGKTQYQIQSYLIPIIYALIAYLTVWLFGWGKFYDAAFVNTIAKSIGLSESNHTVVMLTYVLIQGSIGFLFGAIAALGEEIGWRGFLVPSLFKSQGFTKTSLITGLIWGVWHLPILIFADYNSGTPTWYAMSCFMVLVISISFVYTWYRMKSGSLWTAVILHASHNLYIQSIFTPLTEDTGNTAYFIDEFGIMLPIIAIGFAIYFWSKRKELSYLQNT